MKTRRKVLVWVVALVALAAVFWAVSRPTEPRYQGKRLSYWLKSDEGWCESDLRPDAREAVRQIGTNAIPHLLADLQSQDLPGLGALQWLADWLPFKLGLPSASARQLRAVAGFEALGEMGNPAIPKLQQLTSGPDWQTAENALDCLGAIGGERVCPILMSKLTSTSVNLRCSAAYHLGRLRSEGQDAVEALLVCFGDRDGATRANAARALGQIGVQPEDVVPALTKLISDRDRGVRRQAVSALAAFGQDAVSALPDLRTAADDPDKFVSVQAKRALLRVQCEVRDGAILRGPKERKATALVFTGHEFAEGGETILDALAKHQAKASFFFTGDFITNASFQPLLRRIINDDHLLGPHSDKHLLYCSWDRDRRTLITREQFRRDLEANGEKILETTGRWILAERPPPGDLKEHQGLARQYGYSYFALPRHEPWYFLPPFEHYNRQIADWTADMGMTLINYTPGTRSNADYTGEADKNFVSSQAIFDSILKKEREDPNGLNGFILLLHIGAGPGRVDKFHTRFGELLDVLAAKGYQFVCVDELLEPK